MRGITCFLGRAIERRVCRFPLLARYRRGPLRWGLALHMFRPRGALLPALPWLVPAAARARVVVGTAGGVVRGVVLGPAGVVYRWVHVLRGIPRVQVHGGDAEGATCAVLDRHGSCLGSCPHNGPRLGSLLAPQLGLQQRRGAAVVEVGHVVGQVGGGDVDAWATRGAASASGWVGRGTSTRGFGRAWGPREQFGGVEVRRKADKPVFPGWCLSRYMGAWCSSCALCRQFKVAETRGRKSMAVVPAWAVWEGRPNGLNADADTANGPRVTLTWKVDTAVMHETVTEAVTTHGGDLPHSHVL